MTTRRRFLQSASALALVGTIPAIARHQQNLDVERISARCVALLDSGAPIPGNKYYFDAAKEIDRRQKTKLPRQVRDLPVPYRQPIIHHQPWQVGLSWHGQLPIS